MEFVRLFAAAGAAINVGFLFGSAVGGGDRVTPGLVLVLVVSAVLSIVPFVLASRQAERRQSQPSAIKLLAAAVVIAMVVGIIVYTSAVRQEGQDRLIFVIIPIFQLIIVGLAMAVGDVLRSKRIPAVAEPDADEDDVDPDSDEHSGDEDSDAGSDSDEDSDDEDSDDEDAEPGELSS